MNAIARLDEKLSKRFTTALKSDGKKMADVVRSLVCAYCNLVERANGNPIYTLELKGPENCGAQTEVNPCFAPLKIAERHARYGSTVKTKVDHK